METVPAVLAVAVALVGAGHEGDPPPRTGGCPNDGGSGTDVGGRIELSGRSHHHGGQLRGTPEDVPQGDVRSPIERSGCFGGIVPPEADGHGGDPTGVQGVVHGQRQVAIHAARDRQGIGGLLEATDEL